MPRVGDWTTTNRFDFRPVNTDDIVSPEHGRAAAKEIGAFYYETSVLTRFGVEETFQNAVRAALCRRRQGRLWSGPFQLVKFPQVQAPCLPPKPAVPTIRVLPSCYVEQMANLIHVLPISSGTLPEMGSDRETYYDCVLRSRDQAFLVSTARFALFGHNRSSAGFRSTNWSWRHRRKCSVDFSSAILRNVGLVRQTITTRTTEVSWSQIWILC